LWFRRNLTLIGRLETNFLKESDYGRLIPRQYKESRRFWTVEYWTLLAITYPLVSVVVSFVLLTEAERVVGVIGLRSILLIWMTVLLGFATTLTYIWIQARNLVLG